MVSSTADIEKRVPAEDEPKKTTTDDGSSSDEEEMPELEEGEVTEQQKKVAEVRYLTEFESKYF